MLPRLIVFFHQTKHAFRYTYISTTMDYNHKYKRIGYHFWGRNHYD